MILSREGFRVLTAAVGVSGLAFARREAGALDLVVLDVMLPGLNGFQVATVWYQPGMNWVGTQKVENMTTGMNSGCRPRTAACVRVVSAVR